MRRERLLFIRLCILVLTTLCSRLEAQGTCPLLGNQPNCTNATPCSNQCSTTGNSCAQDSDCCDSANICLSQGANPTLPSPVCQPQRPNGSPCGVNHDCQSDNCDPFATECEPAPCNCNHEPNTTCAAPDICSDGECISQTFDPPNDCALPTCNPSMGYNCGNGDCIPPITCGMASHWSEQPCSCVADTSPIIIDTDGTGFHLTSATNGVLFDFFGNGKPVQIAWTAQDSTNGWLALDRAGNGLISSGKNLFGDITEQPPSSDPNGFLALAVFDEPANGGNGDGIIDNRDAVWPKLLVWIDANHDGVSQPQELHHLDAIGIHSIGLMYTESRRVDVYGNEFRYRGSLNPENGDKVNRVIYDVILTTTDQP